MKLSLLTRWALADTARWCHRLNRSRHTLANVTVTLLRDLRAQAETLRLRKSGACWVTQRMHSRALGINHDCAGDRLRLWIHSPSCAVENV